MTYEEFLDKFKPIKNHLQEDTSFDGIMFETYGEELEFVTAQPHQKIWTILEGEGETDETEFYIAEGYHFVNRWGYIVTEVGREDDNVYNILID